jgi:DNA-binding transcriptional LysR family regulator
MQAMHLRSLDLNLLILFHAVYVERSVSAAAQRLGMSQSALSHGLRRLRDTFRDDLFVRSGLHVQPTPRAHELFEPIVEIIDNLNSRILPSVSFDPTKAVREFRIGGSDVAEVVFLPSLMRQLSEAFRGCTVRVLRLSNADIPDALESGEIELAIGCLPERPQHFHEQVLYYHDYTVIAREGHPRLKEELSLDKYLGEGHIVVASGTDQHLVRTSLAPHNLRRRVITTVGGFLGLPWLLENTEWIATVPTHIGDIFAKTFPIRCYPLPMRVQTYPVASHWHPRTHDEPGHRWMRHFVADLMRRYPDLP